MPAVSVVGDVGVIWSPSHGSLRTPTDDWAGDLLSPNTSVDQWVWGGLRPAALDGRSWRSLLSRRIVPTFSMRGSRTSFAGFLRQALSPARLFFL